MNEFNECVHEVFSAAGDIIIKSMMGGYLVYLNGKLIGDICANELFLKRTPTSDRLLADSDHFRLIRGRTHHPVLSSHF